MRPFSAQSPWNSRPVDPVLGTDEIPRDSYFPTLESGTWSTGVFVARPTDRPQRVVGLVGEKGVWDPDAEEFQTEIVVPHWPSDVLPANGADGHADIVDEAAGVIHSFYKLKQVDGEWRSRQYAWTRLDGRGWGDPAHYFQGARAAAVPTMGGLLRTHELAEDSGPIQHALAISLTFSGLSADPSYVFPATSSDSGANKNKGKIPEGALLMLPADFDSASFSDPRLRRIAEALKRYGGYVVDRNVGTPFVIYAEMGSNARLHPAGRWDSKVAGELDRIRAALRPVVSAKSWLDGEGRPVELQQPMNLLSMRGKWRSERGDIQGRFETWRQAVVFDAAKRDSVLVANSPRLLSSVTWARPKPGQRCRLTARVSGDVRMRLDLRGSDGVRVAWGSAPLADGQSVDFDWPDSVTAARVAVHALAAGPGWARGDLRVIEG